MKILGLKVTHDGAVSLIDNDRLVFSIEVEKIDNNPRYSNLDISWPEINAMLSSYGYEMDDIDQIVLDGWGEFPIDLGNGKGSFPLKFADYGFMMEGSEILKETRFDYSQYGLVYHSYTHVAGHLLGAYCTSPFAREGKDSFVLVWDGPIPPQLFYYRYDSGTCEYLGWLFPIVGLSYANFASSYEPFILPENYTESQELSVAGKVMAYIARGEVREDVLFQFNRIFEDSEPYLNSMFEHYKREINRVNLTFETNLIFIEFLKREFIDYGKSVDCKPVDMMATYHRFVQDLLVKTLTEKIGIYPGYEKNLCYVGGCALNIKWNSAIRESGVIDRMWVPPFSNDSGSALGGACCEMVNKTGIKYLYWSVYHGPRLVERALDSGEWSQRPCSLQELARLLHYSSEPVVFLNDRAELGPRALGNRSILAPAVDFSMKDRLNTVKIRADYRPISPICIEEEAYDVFNPGMPDPHMLYDHKVRENWKDKIPAVCHLDGTARLQTVNQQENRVVYQLLKEYKKLSGIPLLCNTSANYKGKGFFPDAESAQEWGRLDYVWSSSVLYFKKSKTDEVNRCLANI